VPEFRAPAAAKAEGFRKLALLTALPGVPLYERYEFQEMERGGSACRMLSALFRGLACGALSNVEGDGNYVRVQVLTNAGALNRDKQLAVVRQFTDLVAAAAGDPSLTARTWVLLTEAIEGGWGLAGHANTNAELVDAARAQIAELQKAKGAGG
jgi:phenylpyruvate tautomerase PptA (4-oxalocrotonate tautomerase family)